MQPGLSAAFVRGEGGLCDATLTDVREELSGPGTVAPLRHLNLTQERSR